MKKLLIALFLGSFLLLFSGCPSPNVTNYPITGTVTVVQECVPDTPDQITLNITLVKGIQEIGTTITVPLVNGVGNYNTTVSWSGGVPTEWKRITSNDICGGLICVTGTCTDTATDTPTFPIGNPTLKDVRFVCACKN